MAGPNPSSTTSGPASRSFRAGPHVAHVSRFHRYAAAGLGGMMWFWLFYRAKQDGPVLLGLKHPWDH